MFWSAPDCICSGGSVYDYNGAERLPSPSEVVAIVIQCNALLMFVVARV